MPVQQISHARFRKIPPHQSPICLRCQLQEHLRSIPSSSWALTSGYNEFCQGVKHLKDHRTIPGTQCIIGNVAAFSHLMNGLLRDRRVFHIEGSGWFDKYQMAMKLVASDHRGWYEHDVEKRKTLTLERLRTEGWDATRKSISSTIRIMFMNPFMKETTQNNCREAIDWYGSVLEFLEWGVKEWKDVPYNQKEALAHVAVEETRRNAEVEFGPNGSPCDKGFKDAFGNHPAGEAYSILGYVYTQRAHL